MERKGWYLIAYDIADRKRLSKVHRMIKKKAVAAQKSVFFFFGAEKDVNSLLDEAAKIMALDEDDLRAWPITGPKEVWTSGPNPIEGFPVNYVGEV